MILIILSALALISSYAFIGGGIKYLDQIVDQSLISKSGSWITWVLTFGLIFVTSLWTILDYFTAIIAVSLVIGLVGTRKVDNRYFIAIAGTVLPIGIWALLQLPLHFLFASLIPIVFSVRP